MKKRLYVLFVFALCASIPLSGCLPTRNNGTNVENSEKVTISIGGWPQENTVGYYIQEKYLEKFNEMYPNITVEKDNWLYDVNSFLPKAASGQLPTMYNTWFTETAQVFGMGYAYDVTELMKKYEYDKYLRNEILDLVTKDGQMYGIPTGAYALGMMVNMNLFKQAGLVNEDGTPKIPKTFEELAQTSKTIKEKTGKAGYVIPTTNNLGGWHFMPIAWSFGVRFMEQEGGKWKATFDSDECVAAMQFISDLKWKYNALPENAFIDKNEMQKLFATDQVAMYFSMDLQQGLTTTYSMDKNNISMGLIPTGPAGKYSLMGGTFQIIKNGATKSEAEACFKWLEMVGATPKLTEQGHNFIEMSYMYNAGVGVDALKIYEKLGKSMNSNNIIGVSTFGQFTDESENRKYTNEIIGKYANVNLNLFKEYVRFDGVKLKLEEPVCCQQLYSILDGCIQQVLTDKNADIKEIISKANHTFQVNYLNRME